MAVEPIKITGLKEFRDALKRMDDNAVGQLKVAHNSAAELVAQVASARFPKRTGKAAGTIKPKSTRLESRVSGGSKRVPWFAFIDFGGRVGKHKSVRRQFIKSGRYLWPAYADNREKVQEILVASMVQLAQDAGLDVTDG